MLTIVKRACGGRISSEMEGYEVTDGGSGPETKKATAHGSLFPRLTIDRLPEIVPAR